MRFNCLFFLALVSCCAIAVSPSNIPVLRPFTAIRLSSTLNLKATKTASRFYFAPITVGSLKKDFNLLIDLQSDLLWVSCDCVACSTGVPVGFKGKSSFLRSSSSGDKVEINCQQCHARIGKQTVTAMGCTKAPSDFRASFPPALLTQWKASSNCHYERTYDVLGLGIKHGAVITGGSSSGKLYSDKVNFTTRGKPLDRLVTLGCGQFQRGYLGGVSIAPDGVLGLASGFLSMPSQLADQSPMKSSSFSLCLTGNSSSSKGGTLGFGINAIPKGAGSVAQTSFLAGPLRKGMPFFIHVIAFSFNGKLLRVPASAFPSSIAYNTYRKRFTFTRTTAKPRSLVVSVYDANMAVSSLAPYSVIPDAVHSAFVKGLLSAFPKMKTLAGVGDTAGLQCFDASAYKRPTETAFLTQFPMASMYTRDGSHFLLPPTIYLEVGNLAKGHMCFTAVKKGKSPYLVLGEHWLREKFVLFDSAMRKIFWFDADCESSMVKFYNTASIPKVKPQPAPKKH